MPIYHRKFGCEFEFSSDFETVSAIASKAIISIYGQNKLYVKYKWYKSINNLQWHLKLDSSTSAELVTPVSNYTDLPKICKVIQYLGNNDIQVTKNDSFHVHMYAGDITRNSIVVSWIQIEKIFSKIFPPNRRKNDYCKLIGNNRKSILAKKFIDAENNSQEHHCSLSLLNLDKRKTIEFRLAQGTTDPDFITGLVKFYMSYLNYAKHIDPVKLLCEDQIDNMDKIVELLNIKCKKVLKVLGRNF